MKNLYLRIYVTLVVLLLAFAFGAAWLFQRQIEQEREQFEASATERLHSMAMLIQRALPAPDAPREAQAEAVREWGRRLRIPIALEDAKGARVAASAWFERREQEGDASLLSVKLEDGRSLVMMRLPRPFGGPGGPGRKLDEPPPGENAVGGPGGLAGGPEGPRGLRPEPEPGPGPGLGFDFGRERREPRLDPRRDDVASGDANSQRRDEAGRGEADPQRRGTAGLRARAWWMPPFGALPPGEFLIVLLVLLFLAVAISAYPVVRRLTRRLERLKQGVEQFGAGRLDLRVDDQGSDEVGALALSFNRAAERIETLLRSHQSLLANASHELRSPLARMKMAFAMLDSVAPTQRERLRKEIETNISELDALVEEVLLASRLEAKAQEPAIERIDLLGVAVEEAAACGAEFETEPEGATFFIQGEERLLRRALRNLLENARRYGGGQVLLHLRQHEGRTELRVCDRGPGVPEDMRERIFEPFFRLPGHAEQAGGVGLGLSLVKQIAERHGGRVHCEPRDGGGSCFVLSLPAPR